MKNHMVSGLLALLLTAPLAMAQTGDWQVVENLRQRTLISVEDMHHVIHDNCRFQSVVDGQLFCEYGTHRVGPSEVVFRQESIRAVRREQNGALIGLGIGAGAGAAIGAAADSSPGVGRGGSAIIGAGIYGVFGALVGSAHGHFSHGKIIYKNPSEATKSSESLPADREATNDSSPADRMAAARSPYARPENAASAVTPHITLAQFPGRRPGPLFSPYGGYRPYPGKWRESGSLRHVAIGAVIGFGIGAALGAKANKDPTPGATVKASLLVGSIGGLLGALIGQGAPSYARLQRPPERKTDKHWTEQVEVASHPDQSDSKRIQTILRADTGNLIRVQAHLTLSAPKGPFPEWLPMVTIPVRASLR